jgi:hypothetical protein
MTNFKEIQPNENQDIPSFFRRFLIAFCSMDTPDLCQYGGGYFQYGGHESFGYS